MGCENKQHAMLHRYEHTVFIQQRVLKRADVFANRRKELEGREQVSNDAHCGGARTELASFTMLDSGMERTDV